jgi:hypothetical protein
VLYLLKLASDIFHIHVQGLKVVEDLILIPSHVAIITQHFTHIPTNILDHFVKIIESTLHGLANFPAILFAKRRHLAVRATNIISSLDALC